MKRTVAKLVEPKRFEFFDEDIPALAPNEILIKTLTVGLCHSDMPAYLGVGSMGMSPLGYPAMVKPVPYPTPIGHEPIGIVEDVGSEITRYKPGDYISGLAGGAFATYCISAESPSVKLTAEDIAPGKYPLAEPLMCIANIARCAAPEFGDSVAVIGSGSMGLLTIMALKSANLRDLVAIDLKDSRLELAKKYGATKTINPSKEDVKEAAWNMTDKRMFDIVIEISGSLRGFDTAVAIIRMAERLSYKGRGKILIPSLYGKEETWNPNTGYDLMYRAPIIHSSHPMYCMDIQDTMQRGVDMYRAGVLDIDALVTRTFKFEDLPAAFEALEENPDDLIKGVVTFN